MRKYNLLIIALSFCFYPTNLFAQTNINVEKAGGLSETLTALNVKLDTLTWLKLSGEVDIRDFRTLGGAINSLTYIDMSELRIIEYSETIDDKTNTYFGNTIPFGAFSDFSKLETVKLPDGKSVINQLQAIGDKAFRRTAIKEINFPNTLLSIGMEAFQFCNELTSVYIPSEVNAIYSRAFSDCDKLVEILVSNENEIFSTYEGVLISKKGKKIHQYPAGRNAISFIFPPEIVEIGLSAFDGCLNLKELTFSDSILLSNEMSKCKSLESIKVNYVGFGFRVPTSVKSVYIADTNLPIWGTDWIYRVNIDLSKITLYVRPELIQGYKQSASFGADFNYVAWIPTGVNAINSNDIKFTIYPNPVIDSFSIEGLEKTAVIAIVDMTGKTVYNGTVKSNEKVSIAHFKQGMYILFVHSVNIINNFKLHKL